MQYAGVTMYDAMYDYRALGKAWEIYHRDFEPDAYNSPTTIVPGRVLDILDLSSTSGPDMVSPRSGNTSMLKRST